MINSSYQEMDPNEVAYESECVQAFARGSRKGHVKVADERRVLRMSSRLAALESWESTCNTELGRRSPWTFGRAGDASDASDDGDEAAC